MGVQFPRNLMRTGLWFAYGLLTLLVLALGLSIYKSAEARGPYASELQTISFVSTSTSPFVYQIRSTSTDPFFINSVFTYGQTGTARLRCDGNIIVEPLTMSVPYSYFDDVICRGALEVAYNNGNLSGVTVVVTGFAISQANYNLPLEVATSSSSGGGGGTSVDFDGLYITLGAFLMLYSMYLVIYIFRRK